MATEIKAANGAVANGDVTITYNVDRTTINQKGTTTAPNIYIPITNPVSPTYQLDMIKVDFTGGASSGSKTGMVTDMWVYYGNTKVYHAGDSTWAYTSTFTVNPATDFQIADAKSYGVLVTLALSLPNSGSFIDLYSVDVTFKQPQSS